jgi:hypothetical protein
MTTLLNPVGVEVGIVYAIVGPDGTRAVLNDRNDADFVGFLSGEDGVTGLERAGVRASIDQLPEEHGQVHGAFQHEGLSFTLKGIIPPDGTTGGTWLNRQAALLRATAAMREDATLMWTPSEAPPLELKFRAIQPTRLTGRRPKSFLVAGVAEAHTVRAQTEQSLNIALNASLSGGFASLLTSPLSSSQDSSGSGVATGVGATEAWPLITITGPIVNPVITSLRYGRQLRFNYTLAASEALVIDTDPRRRSILLNGDPNASRYGALDWPASSWFPIAPGANELRVGASSFSTGAAATVAWRDAWG